VRSAYPCLNSKLAENKIGEATQNGKKSLNSTHMEDSNPQDEVNTLEEEKDEQPQTEDETLPEMPLPTENSSTLPEMPPPSSTEASSEEGAGSLETGGDVLTKALQEKYVDHVIEKVPKVNYTLSMEKLTKCIRDAFMKNTTQPSFKVQSTKPGAWKISGPPQGAHRVPYREFAPTVRSSKQRARMYAQATFSRWEIALNSVAGVIIDTLLKQHDFKGFTFEDESIAIRGNEVSMAISRDEKIPNAVTLYTDNGGTVALHPMGKNAISLWLAKAGGKCVNVNVTKEGADAIRIVDAPPQQQGSISPIAMFEQAHSAIRTVDHMKTTLLRVIAETMAMLDAHNAEMKKESLRRKRRRRRKNKKKNAAAASTGGESQAAEVVVNEE